MRPLLESSNFPTPCGLLGCVSRTSDLRKQVVIMRLYAEDDNVAVFAPPKPADGCVNDEHVIRGRSVCSGGGCSVFGSSALRLSQLDRFCEMV